MSLISDRLDRRTRAVRYSMREQEEKIRSLVDRQTEILDTPEEMDFLFTLAIMWLVTYTEQTTFNDDSDTDFWDELKDFLTDELIAWLESHTSFDDETYEDEEEVANYDDDDNVIALRRITGTMINSGQKVVLIEPEVPDTFNYRTYEGMVEEAGVFIESMAHSFAEHGLLYEDELIEITEDMQYFNSNSDIDPFQANHVKLDAGRLTVIMIFELANANILSRIKIVR